MDTLALVKSWHERFLVPVLDHPTLPEDRVEMRLSILEEEVQGHCQLKLDELAFSLDVRF